MAMTWGSNPEYNAPPVMRPRDLKSVGARALESERRECNRGIAEREFRRNIARYCQWGLEAVCVAQGVYAWQRFVLMGGEDTFGSFSLPGLASHLSQYGHMAVTLGLAGCAVLAALAMCFVGASKRGAIVMAGGLALAVRFGVEISLDMALVTVANVGIIMLTSSIAAELGRMSILSIKGALCLFVVVFGMAYSIGTSAFHLSMVAQGAVEAGATKHTRLDDQDEVIREWEAEFEEAKIAHRQATIALRDDQIAWDGYRANAESMSASDRAWVMRPDATGPYLDAISASKARVDKRIASVEKARDHLTEAREKKDHIADAVNPAKAILEGAARFLNFDSVEGFNLSFGIFVAGLMELLRIAAATFLNAPLRHSMQWLEAENARKASEEHDAEAERQELEQAERAAERAKRKVQVAAANARAKAVSEWGELRAEEVAEGFSRDRDDLDDALRIPPMPSDRGMAVHKPSPTIMAEHVNGAVDTIRQDISEIPTLESLTSLKRKRVTDSMDAVKRGNRPDDLTAQCLRDWNELYDAKERQVFCEWLVERGMAERPTRKGEGYVWSSRA